MVKSPVECTPGVRRPYLEADNSPVSSARLGVSGDVFLHVHAFTPWTGTTET